MPRIPSLLLVLTLAACGGGGSTDVAGAPSGPYGSMAVRGATDDVDHRHFLRRTQWGVTDTALERLDRIGLDRYLDDMLEYPVAGTTPHEQAARAILLDEDDPPGQEGLYPSRADLVEWVLYLMVHNPNPFQEVLAYFWHDHFATSSVVLGGGDLYWMKDHYEILRTYGAGNLEDLVLRLSRDPAMLRWLDGITSTQEAPNENYAREFLELFCLGVDNGYTQEDILEASRAFTGYKAVTLDRERWLRGVVFDPERHDDGVKTIFGVEIPGQNLTDDYEAVVDITFERRDAASWFAKALLAYFCYEDPPPTVVAELADLLRRNDYDLKPVLKRLFRSEAFYSERAREGLVKSPVEFAVGFVRDTGLPLLDGERGTFHVRQLRWELEAMGNAPTQPPSVNGWPSGELWLSAQAMVSRANFARDVITDRTDQAAAGHDVRDLLPGGVASGEAALERIARRLGVELEEADHADLVRYLDTHRSWSGSEDEDPLDQAEAERVDLRLRGLLYVLAQHPRYALR